MGGLGSELAGDGVAGGIDASSCFPQRPKREGYRPGLTPFHTVFMQVLLGSENRHEMQTARSCKTP